MTALPIPRMTVDEFLPWAETQEGRWELFDGVPVPMSPERVIHGQVKYLAARAFECAISRTGASCHSLLSSVALRIDTHRCHQPDVLVYGGQPLPGDAIEVPNPMVVVEALSPSNAMQVLLHKLVSYFNVPSIVHYLIVDPDSRLVIHHARGGDTVATRILSDGTSLKIDPPGIEMSVGELFPSV
jgi:Uma2 family endonuclease